MQAVLLGCGNWGTRVLKEMVESKFFSHIIVGDINTEKAKALATELSGDGVKLEAQYVNAYEPETFMKAVRGSDVVVNIVAPYTEHCFPIVKLSIEAGVNYIDICDRVDPTRDVLDRLDEPARKAGITALMDMGGHPGLVNVLARYGADQLEEVEEVHTAVVATMSHEPPHNWRQRLITISGKVPIYRDGKLIDVPVLNNFETLQFLEAGVTAETYPLNHPPTITFPRFIKGMRAVSCRLGWYPVEVTRFTHALVSFGMAGTEVIKIGKAEGKAVDFCAALCSSKTAFDTMSAGFGEKGRWSGYLVRVKGKQAGKKIMLSYHTSNKKAGYRSITFPVTMGAYLLARGEIKTKGIIAPEAIEPGPFISELERIGITWREVREIVET